MERRSASLAALVAALVLGLGWWFFGDGGSSREFARASAPKTPLAADGAVPDGPQTPDEPASTRASIAPSPPTAHPTAQPTEKVSAAVDAQRSATLIARLVDGGGAPLGEGWSFTLSSALASSTLRQRVGADGEARYEGLSPGRYRIQATSKDGPSVPPRQVDLESGETARVELVYEPDDRIAITVRPQGRGRIPAAGAFVLRGAGRELRSALDEDRDNLHVFADLAPGEYSLELEDPRFETWIREGLRPGARPTAQLRANSSVAIEVVERSSGEPIENYELWLMHITREYDESGEVRSSGRSGGRAKASGEAVPPDGLFADLLAGDWAAELEAPGFLRREVGFSLAIGERRSLRVELERGARLLGHLLDANGEALARASIQLLSPGQEPVQASVLALRPGFGGRLSRGHGTTTADDGTFAFEGLEAGAWVAHGFFDPGLRASQSLELAEGEEREVQLRFPSAARIRGRVIGPESPTASGYGPDVLVLYATPSGRSASSGQMPVAVQVARDGGFRSPPLPPGPAVLSVGIAEARANAGSQRPPALEVLSIVLHAGQEQDLELDLCAHWPGELHLALSGAPGYSALARGTLPSHRSARAAPDGAGVAKLGPLLPGSYRVFAYSATSNGVAPLPGPVHVPAGGRAEAAIEVREVPGVLRVVDSKGAPMANAEISIDGGALEWIQMSRTDAEGRLQLAYPPATYRVSLSGGGAAAEAHEIHWGESGPEPATLSFSRSAPPR